MPDRSQTTTHAAGARWTAPAATGWSGPAEPGTGRLAPLGVLITALEDRT